MAKRALIIQPIKDAYPFYCDIYYGRSSDGKVVKELLYSLWDCFYEYADPDFVEEMQRDFNPRFWEMYFTCVVQKQFSAIRSAAAGLDIVLDTVSGERVDIECISATKGQIGAADSLPEEVRGLAQEEVERRTTLRLTSALKEKRDQRIRHIESGETTDDIPYVVAINASELGVKFGPEHREVLRALFPIGQEYEIVDFHTGVVKSITFDFEGAIRKANNAKVPKTAFIDSDYSLVSEVVFSAKDYVNLPEEFGSEMVFIHNPMAANPLTKGFFGFGEECWGEINSGECVLTKV